MALGKTRHADAEPADLAEQSHQLTGELETAPGLLKLAGAARRIATEREDVFDAKRTRLFERVAHFRPGNIWP